MPAAHSLPERSRLQDTALQMGDACSSLPLRRAGGGGLGRGGRAQDGGLKADVPCCDPNPTPSVNTPRGSGSGSNGGGGSAGSCEPIREQQLAGLTLTSWAQQSLPLGPATPLQRAKAKPLLAAGPEPDETPQESPSRAQIPTLRSPDSYAAPWTAPCGLPSTDKVAWRQTWGTQRPMITATLHSLQP